MATVCVVDDDGDIRNVVRVILEDAGHTVTEAQDGVQALGLLRASAQAQVVLLNYVMPNGDGGLVLRAIGNEPTLRRHCFILFTATHPIHFAPEVQALIAAHCADILLKPFDLDALSAAVTQAVEVGWCCTAATCPLTRERRTHVWPALPAASSDGFVRTVV